MGIVERIVGEVALRSYQEGYRSQLTHIDRDKGGHEAQCTLNLVNLALLNHYPKFN